MNLSLSPLQMAHQRMLVGALAYCHRLEGSPNSEALLSIWLTFEDSGGVRIATAKDGVSIQCDTCDLTPADMGEYGKLAVADVGSMLPWANCIDQKLTAVSQLVMEYSVIGVDMLFGNSRVYVFNWGDNLYVHTDLKLSILHDVQIKHVKVLS